MNAQERLRNLANTAAAKAAEARRLNPELARWCNWVQIEAESISALLPKVAERRTYASEDAGNEK
jgi:hypothetical protein